MLSNGPIPVMIGSFLKTKSLLTGYIFPSKKTLMGVFGSGKLTLSVTHSIEEFVIFDLEKKNGIKLLCLYQKDEIV